MILLIDIGNTLTKIAVSLNNQKYQIDDFEYFETGSRNWLINFKNELQKVKNKFSIEAVMVSSVVKNKEVLIKEEVKKYFDINPIFLNKDLISSLPITIDLQNNQIGSDFLALAVASDFLYKDSITISLGTATTYSIIKENKFLGAIIGPGFNNCKKSLVQSADLLNSFNIKKTSSVLGKNTLQALSVGFGNGFNCMLQGVIKEINAEIKTNLPVIITGNGFDELKEFFTFEYKYQNNLVLVGLLIIYENLIKIKF